ncbi:porin family protein [Flavobacterium sp.]|uniref:porin family protein n=1 Tax=Flavobacterium sp. TaxID=239 RepID=UPI00286F879D|nr:porin family protein [Flavobacterium sp.]
MKALSFNTKKTVLFVVFLFSCFATLAQENSNTALSTTKIDSLYREDQFYIGVTYNLLKNAPTDFSNDKFSTGFSAGFLRDMPLNKNRNLAIAPGLGLTFNNYSQNIAITTANGVPVYTVLTDATSYSNNKFSQLLVDLPLEFRWRGSTFENHNFFRIHGGIKLSYLLYDRSVYRSGSGDSIITGNADFNKLLYGTYVSAGYGGVNLYVYYGLNPIFKTAQIAGTKVDMKSLNIGLIFYIL